MYIPEFWCGVLAIIVLEIVALIVASIVYNIKKSNKGKR